LVASDQKRQIIALVTDILLRISVISSKWPDLKYPPVVEKRDILNFSPRPFLGSGSWNLKRMCVS